MNLSFTLISLVIISNVFIFGSKKIECRSYSPGLRALTRGPRESNANMHNSPNGCGHGTAQTGRVPTTCKLSLGKQPPTSKIMLYIAKYLMNIMLLN